MTQQRWLRIIPITLIMYAISYLGRTNVSLGFLPPKAKPQTLVATTA